MSVKTTVGPHAKSERYTIRLTPEDQQVLQQLCQQYGLDRPGSLRRAIRQALTLNPTRVKSGHFTPFSRFSRTETKALLLHFDTRGKPDDGC